MVTLDYHKYLGLLPEVRQTPESSVWMTLDKDADVMYINFRKGTQATDTELTDDDIIIRYDGDDIIGFTVLHASKR
ncbi:MAG: DUF2283 domain-containing protein [Candidatus Kapaibacterium sp.]